MVKGRLLLTGRFEGFTHAEARRRLKERGIIASWSLNPRVLALVVGMRSGNALESARGLGLPLLSEVQLHSLIRGADLKRVILESTVSPAFTDPTHDVLSGLRGVLHGEPGCAMWEGVCQHLDRCPVDVLDVAVGYAEGSMGAMPSYEEGEASLFEVQHAHRPWKRPLGLAPENWLGALGEGMTSPKFRLIRALNFGSGWEEAKIIKALKSGSLGGLRFLGFSGIGVGSTFFNKVAKLDSVRSVEHLDLSWVHLNGPSLRAISSGFPGLKRFSAQGAFLYRDNSGWALIARMVARGLRSLFLAQASMDMGNEQAMAGAFAGLKHLALHQNNLDGHSVNRVLAALGSELVHLGLTQSRIGWRGVARLFEMARLSSLESLDLTGCGFSHRALRALERAEHLSGLRRLSLASNPIRPVGIIALSRSAPLSGLTHLNLSRARVSADSTMILAHIPHFAGLKVLDLSHNPEAGDGFAHALTRRATLASIESLDLGGTGLTAEGLGALSRAPCLDTLRVLKIGHNGLPEEEIERFREALPASCALVA